MPKNSRFLSRHIALEKIKDGLQFAWFQKIEPSIPPIQHQDFVDIFPNPIILPP
jgi:hypothetical protein